MIFEVAVTDAVLYCQVHGSGPLMLMIHGIITDSDFYSQTGAYLAKQYTVVTYDRRGYSRSAANDGADFSLEQQANDASAVIRRMNMGPALVVGCSGGALISLALAVGHPDLVRCLFLHEPPIGIDANIRAEILSWMDELDGYAKNRRTARAMLSFIKVLGGVDNHAPKKALEEQHKEYQNLELFLNHEMHDLLTYAPAPELLKNLKMPVILAIGKQSSEGLFARASLSVAEIIGCPMIYLPGYHNVAYDLPLDFAAAVMGVMNQFECLTD